jgi:hypothetical protein
MNRQINRDIQTWKGGGNETTYTQEERNKFAKEFCYWMETLDSEYRLGKSWDELLKEYERLNTWREKQ